MRYLFEINSRNYSPDKKPITETSVRAIIVSHGRIAMVKSAAYGHYRFPGGVVRSGETVLSALAGRVREDAGMIVIPGSEAEYGYVVFRNRSAAGGQIVREELFFLCRIGPYRVPVRPEQQAEGSTAVEFITPVTAIEVNRLNFYAPQPVIERENRILELLSRSGLIK